MERIMIFRAWKVKETGDKHLETQDTFVQVLLTSIKKNSFKNYRNIQGGN